VACKNIMESILMRVRISGSCDLPFVLMHPPSVLVELNCRSPETDRGWARAMRGCSETSVALLFQKHLLCSVISQESRSQESFPSLIYVPCDGAIYKAQYIFKMDLEYEIGPVFSLEVF